MTFYIYIKGSFFSCSSHIWNIKNYNFKFSVTPRFTSKSSMLWFAYGLKHFKKDLFKNPWWICSSIIDLKVGNSPSHEAKRTNWLKNKSHYKLITREDPYLQCMRYSINILLVYKFYTNIISTISVIVSNT